MQAGLKRFGVGVALVVALSVQGCGGSGAAGPAAIAPVAASPVPVPVPGLLPPPALPTQVTVTGQASYEFVPSSPATGSLNYAAVAIRPARGVTVQAISNGTVLASAIASDQGNYALTLPINTLYFLRMRAQVLSVTGPSGTVTADVSVKDNTAQDALWAVDSAQLQSGVASSVNSISAGSGWNGSSYTAGARGAGPFAALDTVYTTLKYLLQADPATRFPPLTLFWSPNNTTARSSTNDFTTGEIGGTFFLESVRNGQTSRAIYLLGRQDDDTDEYDSALIAHEVGHYLQSAFSKDHSVGGSHAYLDKLDMTVAFSEGWATAWSSISRGNPQYFDSFGARQAQGFTFSVASVPTDSERGWYREDSVYSSLYALFQVHGFAPIWQALTGPMAKTQQALATIFSFADAVRSAGNSVVSATLNQILAAQNIFTGFASDAFGQGETNSGASPGVLPVYAALAFDTATPVCFINDNKTTKSVNKLGMVKYFRINLNAAQAGLRTIRASFAVGRDLDFEVVQNRDVVASATADSQGLTSESTSVTLIPGEVIIRVSDFVTTQAPVAPNCATISLR